MNMEHRAWRGPATLPRAGVQRGGRLGNEHEEAGLFTHSEAAALRMPVGYKQSIAAWYARTVVTLGRGTGR